MEARGEPRKPLGLGVPMPVDPPPPDVVEVAPGLAQAIRDYVATAPHLAEAEREELTRALTDYMRATIGKPWVRLSDDEVASLNDLLGRANLPLIE